MTEIPSTAIEAAAKVLVGHPGLQDWEPLVLAGAILKASGLPADLQAALERAEAAETDRDGLWRSLTDSGECGGCSQAYLLGRERTRRRLLEEIELTAGNGRTRRSSRASRTSGTGA